MYKYCWHWTNQCPINNIAGKQWNWNNDLFKVSQYTIKQRRWNWWHIGYWHETNLDLVSKQGRKQITRIVTCSKSAANALELRKPDNTNGICAADVEQIPIPLANSAENEITEIMTCSKSTANSSGSCKQNDTNGVCWWHWTDHNILETYAMINKH